VNISLPPVRKAGEGNKEDLSKLTKLKKKEDADRNEIKKKEPKAKGSSTSHAAPAVKSKGKKEVLQLTDLLRQPNKKESENAEGSSGSGNTKGKDNGNKQSKKQNNFGLAKEDFPTLKSSKPISAAAPVHSATAPAAAPSNQPATVTASATSSAATDSAK